MYTSTPTYVRTQEQLATALAALAASEFVAVDTEFLRERTYYPKLCLVQAANDHYCALIDVLAVQDLTSLWNFLSERTRTKVFHAARQDLEVLGLARGGMQGTLIAPINGPIFDTQVAAAFLNFPAQIGYADLVEKRLGHTLAKGQARTDWSQRPLSDAQLNYAADDVRYLVHLYHDLIQALRNTERWDWLQEDAALLEDPRLYVTDPNEAWQRLRGLDQLEPTQRAVAKALAAWREQRAIDKNLPRSWILADESLWQLAESPPLSLDELTAMNSFSAAQVSKRGDELLQIIATAIAAAEREPKAKPAFKPTRGQMKNVSLLMDFVRKTAADLKVSPEILTTRREVEKLVYSGKAGAYTPAYTRGWRSAIFGQRLIELAQELSDGASSLSSVSISHD